MKKSFVFLITLLKSFCYYLSDFMYSYRTALSSNCDTKDNMSAHIMLLMHSIEKGLAISQHSINNRVWGKDKAKRLTNLTIKYIILYGRDEVCVISINVLNEYRKNKYSDPLTHGEIELLTQDNKDCIKDGYAGCKYVTSPYKSNVAWDYQIIESFYSSRSSVRYFSDEEITDEEISRSLHFAQLSPSACNRQTCKVHIVKDKKLIADLLENQLGDQGWCNNANVLFIITTNNSYFNGSYERHQGYIDGGMYAMNFVMGLHANNIGSCFKMFVRSPKIEKNFKAMASIPFCENPIVLVLAGHFKNEPVCTPISVRLTNI